MAGFFERPLDTESVEYIGPEKIGKGNGALAQKLRPLTCQGTGDDDQVITTQVINKAP